MAEQDDNLSQSPAEQAERWINEHGDALFGFALRRLGKAEDAEDAVQETLLGALQSQAGFREEAAERTWLIGILRHKIFDALRKRSSEQARLERIREQAGETAECFQGGYWRERHNQWSHSAENLMASQEFRAFFQQSIDELPDTLRLVYCLRELDGLDSETICEILGVSQTNLWTLMHRAKIQLREKVAQWQEE